MKYPKRTRSGERLPLAFFLCASLRLRNHSTQAREGALTIALLNLFSEAVVRNHCRLGGFKLHKYIPQSRGCKSKTKVVTRLRPSWNLEGRVLCASSSGTGCPGSWLCSPSCLCLLLLHCSPLSASHPSVTRFRTILLYQDLILTSPVCNTPISRLSSVPK